MERFDWRDGERTVCFGRGRIAEADELLGGPGYTLLTTPRAVRELPRLAEDAQTVLDVQPGTVDAVARRLLDEGVPGDRLVALGGGRVVDVAKACAAARRADGEAVRVLAVPTTLSGAEMTWVHRHAEGVDPRTPRARPDLVLNDPDVSASQPEPELAASTLNAVGHAAEAPVTTLANPVATLIAHEAARRLAAGWAHGTPDREALALGAVLAGAAIDSAWYGLHHVLAQTLVRTAGLAHGTANAILLPHTLGALAWRFPAAALELGTALGEDPVAFATRVCARTGTSRLSEAGVDHGVLQECAAAAAARSELDQTPPRAAEAEILALYEQAF